MVVRRFIAAVALCLATAVTAGARGAESNPDPSASSKPGQCSLGDKYLVRSVQKYTTFVDAGYTSYTQFRGAELIVPAQPGLTREWLQRVVTYQVAAGECNFGAPDVQVSVLPAGDAFSVRIESKDERNAGEILRHAQQLVK